MPEKKEQNKFTIQFSLADPAHRQVIDILNQQGRRKAQFLVNAVQHYLHCPETPDIPQAASLDLQLRILYGVLCKNSTNRLPSIQRKGRNKKIIRKQKVSIMMKRPNYWEKRA